MATHAHMTKAHKSEPARRCIATGDSMPTHGLIRFVVSPDGVIVPDLGERLPGRGIWVSADRSAIMQAVERKLFARAAKAQVNVPADLLSTLETMLAKRCQDIIGLAKRSDLLVVGFDRVLEILAQGGAGIVAIASDAGGGRRDIAMAAGKLPVAGSLTNAELSAGVGKGAVSFLTILRGGLATSLQRENERLTGLRPAEMDEKQ